MDKEIHTYTNYVFVEPNGDFRYKSVNMGAFGDPDFITQVLASTLMAQGADLEGDRVPALFFFSRHAENDWRTRPVSISESYFIGGTRYDRDVAIQGVEGVPPEVIAEIVSKSPTDDVICLRRGGLVATPCPAGSKIVQWPPVVQRMQ